MPKPKSGQIANASGDTPRKQRRYTQKATLHTSDTPDISRAGLYHKDFDERAYRLSLLGLSDNDQAKIFGVSQDVFQTWRKQFATFRAAVEAGRDDADSKVADSLFKRACGYEHDDVELKVVSLGNNQGSEVQHVPVRKIYPPDTQAALSWLKMRQRERWNDQANGLGGNAQDAALAAQAAIQAAWATAEDGGEKRMNSQSDEEDEQ